MKFHNLLPEIDWHQIKANSFLESMLTFDSLWLFQFINSSLIMRVNLVHPSHNCNTLNVIWNTYTRFSLSRIMYFALFLFFLTCIFVCIALCSVIWVLCCTIVSKTSILLTCLIFATRLDKLRTHIMRFFTTGTSLIYYYGGA